MRRARVGISGKARTEPICFGHRFIEIHEFVDQCQRAEGLSVHRARILRYIREHRSAAFPAVANRCACKLHSHDHRRRRKTAPPPFITAERCSRWLRARSWNGRTASRQCCRRSKKGPGGASAVNPESKKPLRTHTLSATSVPTQAPQLSDAPSRVAPVGARRLCANRAR